MYHAENHKNEFIFHNALTTCVCSTRLSVEIVYFTCNVDISELFKMFSDERLTTKMGEQIFYFLLFSCLVFDILLET